MKNILTTVLLVIFLALATTACSNDFHAMNTSGDTGMTGMGSTQYATVIKEHHSFSPTGNVPTAYSGNEIHRIMTEYAGFELSRPLQAPDGFMKLVDGNAVFSNRYVAWRPDQYHAIFTAYGLSLNQQDIAYKLGNTDYAYVIDGSVRFYKGNFAYTGWEFSKILSLYYMPVNASTFADEDNDGVADQNDLCPGTPVGAKVNPDGCWVLDNKTLFGFDSSIINASSMNILEDVAKVINQNPDMLVELDGHTDSKGSAAYNMKLSVKRAVAVKDALVYHFGILPSRMTVVGYGEEKPIATNATAEGRALNRRVELVPLW